MTGYLHRDYALSLADFGAPRELPRSGAVVLLGLDSSRVFDALDIERTGESYPIFCTTRWLGAELPGMVAWCKR